MDDELLQEFINESREHLVTIETDLLAIEQAGARVDPELVNKVFRAAHSIKGCSSFFGLNNVKELAHKAETVLDMLRSQKIQPNAEVTNILLAAFDKLRELVNAPAASQQADISSELGALAALASSYLTADEKPALTNQVTLRDNGRTMQLAQTDAQRVARCGQRIYILDYDLIHDIERSEKNVLSIFRDLEREGEILDCALDFEAVGTLDGSINARLPLSITYASSRDLDSLAALGNLPRERIRLVREASSAADYGASSTVEKAASASAGATAAASTMTSAALAPPAPVEAPSGPGELDAYVGDFTPAPRPEPRTSTPARQESAPPGSSGATAHAADESLRVSVNLLDTLMNLAGELVLSRNQFQAAIAQNNQRLLSAAGQRLSQVTSEIQDAVMRTRLQPIENVFSKIPRLVRDLSSTLSKEVRLEVSGKEVALDRSLVEGLSDPLTHMVRNAIDHGIEKPPDRLYAGKQRSGTLSIAARHEAGQVIIEIADDGKGIDPERVSKAALEKGLITRDQLKGMSEQDKIALIFLPGLSTSESVSQVSGRGVGMDVVKTNLEHLGGQVEINSVVGCGTTFRIKLPLTLTIIPALILSVEGERFAVPQVNVEELLRIRPEDAKRRIEVIGDHEVLLLRDRILPLLRLDDFLGVVRTYDDPNTGKREIDRRFSLSDRRSPRHPLNDETPDADTLPPLAYVPPRRSDGRRYRASSALEIAVITTGTFQFGLAVGSFHNTEEIVVKPLGRDLKGLREYAGATVLGDGAVALILDTTGLAAQAELTSVSGTARAKEQEERAQLLREAEAKSHSLLLFRNTPKEHCAVELEAVRRIERIRPEQVEVAAGRRTFQYCDKSLPLVALADVAKVEPIIGDGDLAVIVSSVYGREVGLLGTMPVDVVETSAKIDKSTHRQRGIAGSAIIRDHTTLIADLHELVDAAYPEWRQRDSVGEAAGSEGTTVLLAEDSDFFRAQVRRYLEAGGYQVIDAPDGEAAWGLLQSSLDKVQLVVTDVEMPRLSGLELTRRIRADVRTASLPVIALTSLADDEDVARGKAVGVNDYMIKIDRDSLLEGVRRLISDAFQRQAVPA
jgi:two-component system, chemotaxis family, sensor kinase CheA